MQNNSHPKKILTLKKGNTNGHLNTREKKHRCVLIHGEDEILYVQH